MRQGIALWMLVGCSPELGGAPVAEPLAARVIDEGSPEAAGVLGFLNDRSTTLPLLDDDVGLDARAARNLIAHRDGPDGVFGTPDDDPFDDIAEVDAVPQVGDAALRGLLAWASANGWIPADDAPLYGVVEGVEFTLQDAVDLLRVANGATLADLDDDARLDARAARGIVENRPFDRVEDVGDVSHVGPAALRALVDYGRAHPVVLLDGEVAIPVLEAASEGLWHSSESDYPLNVWWLPGAEVTAANATTTLADAYVQQEGHPTLAERVGEEGSFDAFFTRVTEERDGWEPEQVAAAARWRALRRVFDTQLANPRLIRLGVPSPWGLFGAIDVFVFGTTRDGALVGFRTVSVET